MLAQTIPLANVSLAMAIGDFNGDGALDLILAEAAVFSQGDVAEFLGNGDGTFQTAATVTSINSPAAMTTGDFNGDGNTDLAVLAPSHLFVLLSNGDGTFRQSADVFLRSLGGRKMLVGDFNGDGKLDLLLVSTLSANSMALVLGNGDGTFRLPLEVPIHFTPSAVALGDFNGDGKLDVVLSSQQPSSVAILLGNGDGTFQAPRTFPAGSNLTAIAVGDFNNDGKLDIAITDSPGSPFPASVLVLMGNGDSSFQSGRGYPVGSNPVGVVAEDLNGDGATDLAVLNQGSSSVSVLLNNGNGTFQDGLDFATGNRPVSIAAGDFNSDGLPDLAVLNTAITNVSVLLNQGTEDIRVDGDPGIESLLFFSLPADFGVGVGALQVMTGDFNGDGKIDLVVLNERSLTVLLNNTAPALQTSRRK
jgi:hypothetical protein